MPAWASKHYSHPKDPKEPSVMKKRTRTSTRAQGMAAALLALAAATSAMAQDAAALRVHSMATTCVACHGTQGRAVANNSVPGLAGMPAVYLVEQMNAFKSGARTATVMNQIAKGYDDAQIQQLAAWFAAQPK